MSSPSKKTRTDGASSGSGSGSASSASANPDAKHHVASGAGAGTGTWASARYASATEFVHGLVAPDERTGAILTPVYLSTTFVQPSVEEYLSKGFSYSRTANPTTRALEDKIALLEEGYGATCFGTGMAATTTVMSSLLAHGDHAILPTATYGGTNRITRMQFKQYGIDFSYVDMSDPANVEKAIIPGRTKLVFTETPANPTLVLTDVAAVSDICRKHKIVHACDSTFATPLVTKPLALGADLAVLSLTKYYDGHNVTVAGAVVARTKELHDKMQFTLNMHGNALNPHSAFLILQFSKTMELRVRKQSETALKIAHMLEKHPKVERVSYPGLASFPQKELADRQHLNGLHGGMLWFEVRGGTEAGRKLMNTVQRPWSLCENLGACESIITACAIFTHANMLREDRLKAGITDGLVRVSCGIEDAQDLIDALKDALDRL